MRWILVAVLIGGLVVLAVAVPIGGRTVLERITGQPPAPVDQPVGQDTAAAGSDRLTDQDRQKLDKLIESKLETTEPTKK